jgi:uncharacterized protein with von Willebrand factor type A (vWA) domain
MDMIPAEDFNNTEPAEAKTESQDFKVSDAEIEAIINDLKDPLQAQLRLAAQLKNFLDKQIATDFANKGSLSDHTRRWVETYNTVLNDLRKTLSSKEGTAATHTISHSDIAAKIRSINLGSDNTPAKTNSPDAKK